jgi:hypothetical protein
LGVLREEPRDVDLWRSTTGYQSPKPSSALVVYGNFMYLRAE